MMTWGITNSVSVLLLASTIFASTPLQAEEKQQLSPDLLMEPMKVMMKSMLEVMASPEVADAMASFYKQLYDALQDRGFSKDEAMQIVVSQGAVLSSSSNK